MIALQQLCSDVGSLQVAAAILPLCGRRYFVEIKRMTNRMAACGLAFALWVVAATGCAVGNYMTWKLVDPTVLSSDTANQKWNTYRFDTVGPTYEQRVAYVLFGDNVTVDMWHVPYVNLGKMSIQEVLRDHDAYLKSQMWVGTSLIFHECQREGKLIAYTANELDMDVDLWEMAASGSQVNLRMIYLDRRSSSGPSGGGPQDQGGGGGSH
jgi:hypothetical protein